MDALEGTAPGQVTIADLFRVMSGIQIELSKVVTRLEVINKRNDIADLQHADYETRLRNLESFKAKLVGVSLFVGTVAGVLSGYLSSVHH